jgi:hypothetical protein
MPKPYRLSAYEAAILTIYLIQTYSQEKGRNASRARLSQSTLRRLADRERLRSAFIDEWIDELAALGWSAFPVGDKFAIVETATTDGWPRIATNRIRDELDRIHGGETRLIDEISEKVVRPEEDAADDE